MRAHWHVWILALPVVMTPGCTATKSAADLEVVQNTRGFWTKSLYYAGSSRGHHYFEQWDPVSVKNLLVPSGITFMGKDLKNPWQRYRVARSGVTLPPRAEFPRGSYAGENDERRRKMRIRETEADAPGHTANFRKEGWERIEEKHGPFDPSKLRVQSREDGGMVMVYDDGL